MCSVWKPQSLVTVKALPLEISSDFSSSNDRANLDVFLQQSPDDSCFSPQDLEGSSGRHALAVAHAHGASGSRQMAWHMLLHRCPPLDLPIWLPLACYLPDCLPKPALWGPCSFHSSLHLQYEDWLAHSRSSKTVRSMDKPKTDRYSTAVTRMDR